MKIQVFSTIRLGMLSSISILTIFVLFCSCANYNSNSFDATAFQGIADDDPNFKKAFNIIQNKCAGCHWHKNLYPSLNTSKKWVESGQVVPFSSATSILFTRLQNPAGGGGNMPQDQPPLTAIEYEDIRTWIDNINLNP